MLYTEIKPQPASEIAAIGEFDISNSTERAVEQAHSVVAANIAKASAPEFGLFKVMENADLYSPGDLGNAERFYDAFGDTYKYVSDEMQWYKFDGARWKLCTCGDEQADFIRVVRTMKDVAVQMQEAAKNSEQDSFERTAAKAVVAHYTKSCSAVATTNAITQATRDKRFKVATDKLDADPYLLNTPAGTIDLRTGELREVCREDLITQVTSVAPVAGEAPVWKKFLDDVFLGDADLIKYVQKVFGSAMLGMIPTEQQFFMASGGGGGGKSTLFNTVVSALGDYAVVTMPEMWQDTGIERSADSATPGALMLRGKRLVLSPELKKGKKFNESFIKQVTGGDVISGRNLYKGMVSFNPVCTLLSTANHRPNIASADYALWRRAVAIPFKAKFTEETKDVTLPEKLKAEMPQIMNWLIEGCLAYQAEGLKDVPDAIREAMADYKKEMDKVNEFLDNEDLSVDVKSNEYQSLSELYSLYVTFCKMSNYTPMNLQNFKNDLLSKGCTEVRRASGKVIKGIRKADIV